jgi:hypothetical protein
MDELLEKKYQHLLYTKNRLEELIKELADNQEDIHNVNVNQKIADLRSKIQYLEYDNDRLFGIHHDLKFHYLLKYGNS